MKVTSHTVFILIICLSSFSQTSLANKHEWNYDNYLYSLNILSHDNSITAGQSGAISVQVGANTDVVLHVEFKGEFYWGHWVFHSTEIQVSAGVTTVSTEVCAPFKSLIEPASEFYYYVYLTLPGDEWNPSAWGLAQAVTVMSPEELTHEELVACMSHLKWLVDTSSLSYGIRQSLFSKLENTGNQIDAAYDSGNMNKLLGAIGSMESFINELDSDNEAASYPDSSLWKGQSEFIIERMELAI